MVSLFQLPKSTEHAGILHQLIVQQQYLQQYQHKIQQQIDEENSLVVTNDPKIDEQQFFQYQQDQQSLHVNLDQVEQRTNIQPLLYASQYLNPGIAHQAGNLPQVQPVIPSLPTVSEIRPAQGNMMPAPQVELPSPAAYPPTQNSDPASNLHEQLRLLQAQQMLIQQKIKEQEEQTQRQQFEQQQVQYFQHHVLRQKFDHSPKNPCEQPNPSGDFSNTGPLDDIFGIYPNACVPTCVAPENEPFDIPLDETNSATTTAGCGDSNSIGALFPQETFEAQNDLWIQ